MDHHFIICVRDVKKDGTFGNEPGGAMYLRVPNGETPTGGHAVPKDNPDDPKEVIPNKWLKLVMSLATTSPHSPDYRPTGDLLVFIHGFNTDLPLLVQRHRQLRKDLKRFSFQDSVVSFAWPSAGNPLAYLEDRDDAKQTALHLVKGCILPLSHQQQMGCRINVHLLAHSTGAYIIREAFDDADDNPEIASANWMISQALLIGADVSSNSLSANNSSSGSLYRHCIRLTNYWSPFDWPLSLSGVKRAGAANRAGRIGLPPDTPLNAVDINCGEYWNLHGRKRAGILGDKTHSWYLGDPVFVEDMVETMRGTVDRHYIRTRRVENGKLVLIKPRADRT